jgi:hypothetical protein
MFGIFLPPQNALNTYSSLMEGDELRQGLNDAQSLKFAGWSQLNVLPKRR